MAAPTFTAAQAKRKFARPILDAFRAIREEPGIGPAQIASRERQLFRDYQAVYFQGSRIKPFAGKYPTRVLIFKAPNYNLINTYYYGKRTRSFNIREIKRTFSPQVKWLEFDRENLVLYFDFLSGFQMWNANLGVCYYPTLNCSGVNCAAIFPVVPQWSDTWKHGMYYLHGELLGGPSAQAQQVGPLTPESAEPYDEDAEAEEPDDNWTPDEDEESTETGDS